MPEITFTPGTNRISTTPESLRVLFGHGQKVNEGREAFYGRTYTDYALNGYVFRARRHAAGGLYEVVTLSSPDGEFANWEPNSPLLKDTPAHRAAAAI